ncbi:unnamed protein product [Victoria cruziana]
MVAPSHRKPLSPHNLLLWRITVKPLCPLLLQWFTTGSFMKASLCNLLPAASLRAVLFADNLPCSLLRSFSQTTSLAVSSSGGSLQELHDAPPFSSLLSGLPIKGEGGGWLNVSGKVGFPQPSPIRIRVCNSGKKRRSQDDSMFPLLHRMPKQMYFSSPLFF